MAGFFQLMGWGTGQTWAAQAMKSGGGAKTHAGVSYEVKVMETLGMFSITAKPAE